MLDKRSIVLFKKWVFYVKGRKKKFSDKKMSELNDKESKRVYMCIIFLYNNNIIYKNKPF
jgi:hypothetical protein